MNHFIKRLSRPIINRGLKTWEVINGFKTDPTGYIPNRVRMLTKSYEPFLIETILSLLPPSGVFVDVGANVGYVSRRIAEARPLASTIIAVEPNPRLKPIIHFNLKNFSNCVIHPVGFGSCDSTLQFYHSKDSAVGSFVKGYNEAHHLNNPAYKTETICVPVKKGSLVLKDFALIDVMKVDVEGFELEAFKGLKEILETGKIRNIVFEFRPLSLITSGESVTSTITFLKNFGFHISGLEGSWNKMPITETNLKNLLDELGQGGYTTLLATLK